VAYELTDTHGSTGSFCCIPGTHKSCFRMPDALRDLSQGLHPRVRRVRARAGAAIIFNEALTHGTAPHAGDQERRTLFFKYAPLGVAFSPYFSGFG
jgi:ectoine hydroxylase-related dioxygenase (phytanoyl-CoA dioxygenase family)